MLRHTMIVIGLFLCLIKTIEAQEKNQTEKPPAVISNYLEDKDGWKYLELAILKDNLDIQGWVVWYIDTCKAALTFRKVAFKNENQWKSLKAGTVIRVYNAGRGVRATVNEKESNAVTVYAMFEDSKNQSVTVTEEVGHYRKAGFRVAYLIVDNDGEPRNGHKGIVNQLIISTDKKRCNANSKNDDD